MATRPRRIRVDELSPDYSPRWAAPPPVGRQPPFAIAGNTLITSYPKRHAGLTPTERQIAERVIEHLATTDREYGDCWIDPVDFVTIPGRFEHAWVRRRLADHPAFSLNA
jgi:hypothetical protein